MNRALSNDWKETIELANAQQTKPISMRSPDEILAMPRNPKANFLGDRLIGIAQQLVLAGIGGLGKSRLLLQLLVALVLELIWCGLETHNTKGTRWMLIQTQNGMDRLQKDLESLKKYVGQDWPLVNQNLKIHTLETDRDLMLHLSDHQNVHDLECAIREFDPIGVAYDPLVDFGIGDLSRDVDMAATCSVIGRISRTGNPERAIIIATHAITGMAGIKKAFGFEAAGFGRNSKVLQTWARSVINIVPATEDYGILVLTCGKNNDGKMFEPLAIRRTDELIYVLEPDFDITAFRERIESPRKAKTALTSQIFRELLEKNRFYEKTQLVAIIKEETGRAKSRAYDLIREAIPQRVLRIDKTTKMYVLV
jgi:hypothetical protein